MDSITSPLRTTVTAGPQTLPKYVLIRIVQHLDRRALLALLGTNDPLRKVFSIEVRGMVLTGRMAQIAAMPWSADNTPQVQALIPDLEAQLQNIAAPAADGDCA